LLLATIGSILQGSIGFGLAVVAAPILLLMDPIFVPGPLLLAATLLVVLIAWRDRRDVILGDVALGTVGRILGTLPAAYAISTLPVSVYEMLFAALILFAVALSISGWHIRPTPRSIILAAILSGFTGTLCSVGGPPMALVYQHEKGPRVRGTMSAIFINGTIISLIGLWRAKRFGLPELIIGLSLMPAIVVGFAISRRVTGYLDRAHLRPMILAVSALSAVAILVRALVMNGR